ncbi:MAG TPA: hypothetical protein VLH13_05820 [Methanomassiliicoccales archaeon]|nr:hypothetical protein [Methanomassiliicoccales archaeon]
MSEKETVKVLAVITVAVLLVFSAIIVLFYPISSGADQEYGRRENLRGISEDVALRVFNDVRDGDDFQMVLGDELFLHCIGESVAPFSVNSSWVGFVLTVASTTGGSVNRTVYDPTGTNNGQDGTSGSSGWASSQVFTMAQMMSYWDDVVPANGTPEVFPGDHWNGTWRIAINDLDNGGDLYLLVLPILYLDPETIAAIVSR